jgi:hypothetical protein
MIHDKQNLDYAERKEALFNKHELVIIARMELISNKQKMVYAD